MGSDNHWSRAILHIDMDAFYASVEIRDNPELRDLPIVVGGPVGCRSVVSAASYVARRFGIHSAMPIDRAVKLCPDLIIMPVRIQVYAAVSQEIFAIFHKYTPLVEGISLDEAFLDVTASQSLIGCPLTIGRLIKTEIKAQTQLTASIGIATSKFVAKIASDLEKPDGFCVIPDCDIKSRLWPLPVTKLWGVGPKTAEILAKMQINTVEQLATSNRQELIFKLGKSGERLIELANGIDNSAVSAENEVKSISQEETFTQDCGSLNFLEHTLLTQADSIAVKLRQENLTAQTVTIKVRYGDFTTITRQQSLSKPFDTAYQIHQVACRLLREKTAVKQRKLRLLGVGVSGLAAKSKDAENEPGENSHNNDLQQLTLFDHNFNLVSMNNSQVNQANVSVAGSIDKTNIKDNIDTIENQYLDSSQNSPAVNKASLEKINQVEKTLETLKAKFGNSVKRASDLFDL